MPTFKILCFDGGGVKGALSSRLLARLTQEFPNLLDETDMIAGTSTGGIIALALAYGKSPSYIDSFYDYDNLKYAFSPSHFSLFRPKYNNVHLQTLLERTFPSSLRLAHLNKVVFVPSFYLKNHENKGYEAIFFTNLVNNPTIKETLVNVALSTCAAPIYFPSHNSFIDGGVVANAPTAAPLLYTKSLFEHTYRMTDFRVLSIGTGSYPLSIKANTHRWGIMQWSYNPLNKPQTPLLNLLLDDASQLEITYCKQLLRHNFFRLNPPLPKDIGLDDYKAIPLLKEIADQVDLKDVFYYIKNFYLR
jgi:patatin-like phospholipase/acyl hydrolase